MLAHSLKVALKSNQYLQRKKIFFNFIFLEQQQKNNTTKRGSTTNDCQALLPLVSVVPDGGSIKFEVTFETCTSSLNSEALSYLTIGRVRNLTNTCFHKLSTCDTVSNVGVISQGKGFVNFPSLQLQFSLTDFTVQRFRDFGISCTFALVNYFVPHNGLMTGNSVYT